MKTARSLAHRARVWVPVSYGTAEAQLETDLDECLGLLAAAVKGMGDAARDAEAA